MLISKAVESCNKILEKHKLELALNSDIELKVLGKKTIVLEFENEWDNKGTVSSIKPVMNALEKAFIFQIEQDMNDSTIDEDYVPYLIKK